MTRGPEAARRGATATGGAPDAGPIIRLRHIPVASIRPEDGLGRQRDREGHRELQRSIEQFGVLTPITVRPAPEDPGQYLLIKGQGRTLACRILGIEKIPAIVLDGQQGESEKVQQFLVENVARLKMRPVDRALLIHRARQEGEETSAIARRFGVSAITVRRLLVQLEGVSSNEVATLRAGDVSLATHAVVARHVLAAERVAVLQLLGRTTLKTKDVEGLFVALGWSALNKLGPSSKKDRLKLLEWACATMQEIAPGSTRERLRQLAMLLPMEFGAIYPSVARV